MNRENKKSVNAREIALTVLMLVQKAQAWTDGALKKEISKYELDSREAALASKLTYGVVQNQMYLDYYIGIWCAQRPSHLEPIILNVLRLGAYQILFLDKIPDSAAVNESVNLVKNHNRAKASGMVNAVLRKISLNKENLPPIRFKNDIDRLSVQYSHPKWLVEKFVSMIGINDTEMLLEKDNETVNTVIQVNTTKIDRNTLKKKLIDRGIAVEDDYYLENAFSISGFGDLEHLPEFKSGMFWVQDTAARLVSMVAQPKKYDAVLDVCAAPGGKSFSLAVDMNDEGKIFSCDVHPHKIHLIENGAKRLGLTSINAVLADGREFHSNWNEKADIVVVDAPCSGIGIIRKKPDIRYKNDSATNELPNIQMDILNNASKYVKSKGVLLYSTCTLMPEENENIVNQFLKNHPEYVLEKFELPRIGVCDGYITLWPHIHNTDGFFISRMRKV